MINNANKFMPNIWLVKSISRNFMAFEGSGEDSAICPKLIPAAWLNILYAVSILKLQTMLKMKPIPEK